MTAEERAERYKMALEAINALTTPGNTYYSAFSSAVAIAQKALKDGK